MYFHYAVIAKLTFTGAMMGHERNTAISHSLIFSNATLTTYSICSEEAMAELK